MQADLALVGAGELAAGHAVADDLAQRTLVLVAVRADHRLVLRFEVPPLMKMHDRARRAFGHDRQVPAHKAKQPVARRPALGQGYTRGVQKLIAAAQYDLVQQSLLAADVAVQAAALDL